MRRFFSVSFFRADHLLSSFSLAQICFIFSLTLALCVFILFYLCFLFYAKLLRFTIHCIFNLVGSTTTTMVTPQGHQTNSKGPKHINKDFISFIRFVSFLFTYTQHPLGMGQQGVSLTAASVQHIRNLARQISNSSWDSDLRLFELRYSCNCYSKSKELLTKAIKSAEKCIINSLLGQTLSKLQGI